MTLCLRGGVVNGHRGYTVQDLPVRTPQLAGCTVSLAWKDPARLIARIRQADSATFAEALPVLPAERPYPAEKIVLVLEALETLLGTGAVGDGLLTRTSELLGAAVCLEDVTLQAGRERDAIVETLNVALLPHLAQDGIYATAVPFTTDTRSFLLVVENLGQIVAEDDPRLGT